MGPGACARQLKFTPSDDISREDVQDKSSVELIAPGADLITV
ncbi:hypothetical protein JOE62_002220 [Glutamicibacter nicotianae]|nr:hypothetical protein [Glutamicibacter nicotianae]